MKKYCMRKCILAAALCAALLAGCGESASSSAVSDGGAAALSAAPAGDVGAPVGDAEGSGASAPKTEPASSQEAAGSGQADASVPPAAETAYGSGTVIVEAVTEGYGLERLEFQDGVLVYHYFSRNDIGKGSYGRDGSDELEYSPYYQASVEEASALLEQEGYTVSIQQQ